jgi:exosortase C (VPDSG-CTERM-specific)
MKSNPEAVTSAVLELPRPQRLRIAALIGYVGLLSVFFAPPLAALLSLAIQNPLHSHIPLIPFVAGYLLYLRPRPASAAYHSSMGSSLIGTATAVATLAAATTLRATLSVNDYVALMMLSYLIFIVAGGLFFLGTRAVAAALFPISILIFMIPLPDAVVYWLETASVFASADVSALLFNLTGTPLLRNGSIFALPGITFEVAQECSGIRSSWVLFITSVIASHLFLDSPWRRIVLVTFIIPLAIVRNAFRILVIGLLCVHVGPHMIDSVIHHRGGPIFFVLSLVPLFLLITWLRRGDRGRPSHS